MKSPHSLSYTFKKTPTYRLNTLVIACALALSLPLSPAQATADLSSVPLYALQGVPPNIALTFDDSGSMSWAAVPDNRVVTDAGLRWRSAHYNAMYYNPNNRYPAPANELGVPFTTSFTNAFINGFDPSRGAVNLANNYRATIIYDPNVINTQTFQAVPVDRLADYAVFNAGNPGCDGLETTNACYTRVIVGAASGPGTIDINGDGIINAADRDERQNFANWYSFYRTRYLATVSGASIAFAQLGPDIRLGFQALTSCAGFTTNCRDRQNNVYDSRITKFDGAFRTNFFRWLQRTPASGGTPLLAAAERAGNMFTTNRPYDFNPGVTTNPVYECRGNFSIIMTDGIWNGGLASAATGNFDNTARTLPDGQSYTPGSPYASASANNLADIAMRFWATDLRTDLPQSAALAFMPVKVNETFGSKTFTPYWNPKNNPATWQHMVTYTLGLGLGSWLGANWGGSTFETASGAFPSLADGSMAWPATANNAIPGNVYDLWQAAINGRGGFYSAESPDDVVQAFAAIIKGILDRQGSAVAASLSNPNLNSGILVYQTEFNTVDWSGNLLAYGVSNGSNDGASCNNLPRGSVCPTKAWEAAPQLNSLNWNTGRKIITNNNGVGTPFTWADISTAQKALLSNGDALGEKRLQFLRGDRFEETSGSDTKPFRKRSSVMGDVINSAPAPLFVGAPDFYYPNDPDYAAFQAANANRTKMVYVGVNDGMLHGFDALTGEEKIAFVPNAVYPNLWNLTRKDYAHQSFVDGGMVGYDLKIGGTYKTYLFGGLGLGGKSVYALDITDPSTFSQANAANIFRWEFSDANLGYTYGKPKVVRVRIGGLVQNALIFGSGFTSGATAAALYVVNPQTGALISRLPVATASGTTNFIDNGMVGVTPVDIHGLNPTDPADGVTDAVYAGDLYGNVWKFDFTGAAPRVAFGTAAAPQPWFVAQTSTGIRQPITTEPAAIRHPTRNGVIVYFGTGKYLGVGDITTTQVQSMYGVWDKQDTSTNLITRQNLLEQRILMDDTTKFTLTDARVTTKCPIRWHDTDDATLPGAVTACPDPIGAHVAQAAMGWFIDLKTESGERVHQAPIVNGDRVIFVTVTPSANPCQAGGASWIYEFQANSGSRLLNTTPWDYNGDLTFDQNDYVQDPSGIAGATIPASGIRFDGAGVYYLDKESIIKDGDREFKMISTSSGGLLSVPESGSTALRRTWNEVIAE